MATLAGATIATTFKSLLKLAGNTDDLAAGGSTAIQVMTGDGENTPIYLNTDRVGIGTDAPGAISTGMTQGGDALVPRLEIRGGSSGVGAGAGMLVLSTAVTAVANTQLLGCIAFQAPAESGTAALKAGAAIVAEATGTFGESINATSLKFKTGADDAPDDRMTILSSGYVGIGTTAPSEILQISNTVHGSNVSMRFTAENVGGTGKEALITLDPDTETLNISCRSGSNPDLCVKSDGNVGIGVDDPAQKLEVNTVDDNTDCFIKLDADVDNDAGIKFGDSGTEYWQIRSSHTGVTDGQFFIEDGSGDGTYLGQDLGNTAATDDWLNTSDLNLKTDISSISSSLTKVNQIRGVNFKWKKYRDDAVKPDKYTDSEWSDLRARKDVNRVGVIAQEINAVLPEAVDSSVDGKWGVSYNSIIPLLIEAVKELSAKVTALENA